MLGKFRYQDVTEDPVRLRLRLRPAAEEAVLPVQYNSLIQGFIYRHLNGDLAGWVHARGILDGKRSLWMFTFSRLLARGEVRRNLIRFTGLVVTSPLVSFVDLFAASVVHRPPHPLRASAVPAGGRRS